MNIKENLKLRDKLLQDILAYFEVESLRSYEIQDYTDQYWNESHGSIWWAENIEDVKDGGTYSGDIYGSSIWSKEEFTLTCINNGCGDHYCAIFSNTLKVNEE